MPRWFCSIWVPIGRLTLVSPELSSVCLAVSDPHTLLGMSPRNQIRAKSPCKPQIYVRTPKIKSLVRSAAARRVCSFDIISCYASGYHRGLVLVSTLCELHHVILNP